MQKYDVGIMILETNKVIYICDNHMTIYLPFVYSIEFNNNNIYQPNSINIVIIIPGALSR